MSSSKKYQWFKIDGLVEWQSNNLCIVSVNNKTITLAKKGEDVFACAHKCPHAGGILADGFIDALGNVVCPLHRYKFSLKNGRNVLGEGYYLKTYPVEIREDGLYLGFEEKSFLGLF